MSYDILNIEAFFAPTTVVESCVVGDISYKFLEKID
jgi:hypothetical protein